MKLGTKLGTFGEAGYKDDEKYYLDMRPSNQLVSQVKHKCVLTYFSRQSAKRAVACCKCDVTRHAIFAGRKNS